MYSSDRPMYLHAIAMGNDPKSKWLKTYVGAHGMIGYAPTPEHVGSAFENVIGKLHDVEAVFSAKVTVVRGGKVVSERTHQLGVKTTRRAMATFDIDFLETEMRLRPGDVITVSSMGHTDTVEVEDGHSKMTRTDLWKESEVVARAEAELNDVQELVESGSSWEAMNRLKIASERSGPEAVRDRLKAAYRSLSSHSHEEEGEEEEEEEQDAIDAATYRSLCAGVPLSKRSVGNKKSKKAGGKGGSKKSRTDSSSLKLASASSLTSSQY